MVVPVSAVSAGAPGSPAHTPPDPAQKPPPAAAPPAAPQPAAPPVTLHSNPVTSIDPELSIVVLRFFNDSGAQTQSIPTQRQIELYRLHLDAAAEAVGETGP